MKGRIRDINMIENIFFVRRKSQAGFYAVYGERIRYKTPAIEEIVA
jgi:hypothetical protein